MNLPGVCSVLGSGLAILCFPMVASFPNKGGLHTMANKHLECFA